MKRGVISEKRLKALNRLDEAIGAYDQALHIQPRLCYCPLEPGDHFTNGRTIFRGICRIRMALAFEYPHFYAQDIFTAPMEG